MKRLMWYSILLMMLSACADAGVSLTAEANYLMASTQITDLRITATVQSARAATTLDFLGTRGAVEATRSIFLEETLVATGFAPDTLATQRQAILGSSPTPTTTNTPLPEITEETIGIQGDARESLILPTPIEVTINAPNPTATPLSVAPPTPDLGALQLGDLVTATGTGEDGCGTGITSIFNDDVPEIYVILPTFNLSANTYNFAARWQRDGQAVGPVYEFTPDYDADALCIWFFVDPSDFAFEAGNYSVAIDINGQLAAGPVPFLIQE
ncbi:MAG: hypothetical protein ACFE0Q_13170 [Anaerolineae bacterium]